MSHPREEIQEVKDHLKNNDKAEAIQHLDYLIHGLEKQDRKGDSLKAFIRDLKRIKTNAMVDVQKGVKACDQLLEEINRNLGGGPEPESGSDYKVNDTLGEDTENTQQSQGDKETISASDIAAPDRSHIEEEIERLQEDIMYLEQRLDEVEED